MQKLIVLAETGKSKAALKNAKQFEKLYPNDPALKNFIGVVYASTGNGDLAAKTFRKSELLRNEHFEETEQS